MQHNNWVSDSVTIKKSQVGISAVRCHVTTHGKVVRTRTYLYYQVVRKQERYLIYTRRPKQNATVRAAWPRSNKSAFNRRLKSS